LKHELVPLGAKIDWHWIDREIASLYSDKGRPGIETRFVIGLLLQAHLTCPKHEWSDLSTGASSSATSWSCCWPRACG
jgi:hypothetical protein